MGGRQNPQAVRISSSKAFPFSRPSPSLLPLVFLLRMTAELLKTEPQTAPSKITAEENVVAIAKTNPGSKNLPSAKSAPKAAKKAVVAEAKAPTAAKAVVAEAKSPTPAKAVAA